MNSVPTSPYKGLSAFEDSEVDALLFFGRERENEIVVANLIASRLTVLYGPSGVGKSSLLRASVARSLRELPEEPLVVVFSRWSEDPEAALAEAVAAYGGGRNGSAVAALEHAQSERDVYLVLDQAEEYFLYHADESGPGTFAEALPSVLAAPLRVNVLVSLREDSLAKLDRFTGRIPGLFANTLRLDRLDRAAAQAAIVRPVERFNELTGSDVAVEAELVERVLEEVGAGQIEPAPLGGLGAVEGVADGARIEAPYLQVVMQRLWDEERLAGSDLLRLETLERLGGAQKIVEEHLQGAMDELTPSEKDVAARLFNHLVTPSGTKIAHELPDLVDFGEVPPAELQPVLSILTNRRILRSLEEGGGSRYEIFHDVLAQPMLAWRAAHETERELEHEREAAERRHRRLLAVIVVGAILLAAMSAVTAYALSQRSEAEEQAREARAHQLEALSAAGLEADPERSLLLALTAARLAPSETAERALRSALLASRQRDVVDAGAPLLGATLRGDEMIAATGDGVVTVTDRRTGESTRISSGSPSSRVSFATGGTAVLTGEDGRVRVARLDGETNIVPGIEGVGRAEISPDGTRAVVIDDGRARLIAVGTGEVLRSFAHPGVESADISRLNSRLVTGAADGTVRVWATESGRLLRTFADQKGHAVAVDFSPDAASVASASTDGVGRIWRVADGQATPSIAGDAVALTDIDFSSDGEHVVTASRDGTVRVSKADTGVPLLALTGHRDWVASAAFKGPAGSAVVTAGRDGTARVWDALYQPKLDPLSTLGVPVLAVESLGDEIRAVTRDRRMHTLDATTGESLDVERADKASREITGPNGARATIRGNMVDLSSAGGTTTLEGHRDRVLDVAFSDDGELVATASRDHDVRVWDGSTGEQLRILHHNSEVRDVDFSADGRWLLTAAGRAALWDDRADSPVLRLQGHEGPFTATGFDPSGRLIVSGGVDGTVRTYSCQICGGLDELVALAERRLAATGRELTDADLEQALG